MSKNGNLNPPDNESPGSKALAALPETGAERDSQIQEAADELRTEMEGLAAELKTLILSQPPTGLLGYLWAQFVLSQIRGDQKDGELQIDEVRETIVFVLEYVHAVTSCFDVEGDQIHEFDEATAQKVIDIATTLRQTAIFYSMASSTS